MALIKWSGLISEFKGKLNGSIFSNPTYGAQVRNRKSCKGRDSTKWGAQKTTLSFIASSWKSLTSAERDSFISKAVEYPYTNKFGDIVTPSGYQLYCTLNLNLLAANFTPIQTALSPVSELGYAGLTLGQAVSSALQWEFTYPNNADVSLLCYVSPPVSQGVYYVPRTMKLIQVISGSLAGPVAAEDEYEAIFGVPAYGTKLFWRCEIVDKGTGQRYGSYNGSLDFNFI